MAVTLTVEDGTFSAGMVHAPGNSVRLVLLVSKDGYWRYPRIIDLYCKLRHRHMLQQRLGPGYRNRM